MSLYFGMCIRPIVAGKATIKYIAPYIARQRLRKHVTTAKNTRNSKGLVGRVCLCLSVYRPIVIS
jgi:hypothetical protein